MIVTDDQVIALFTHHSPSEEKKRQQAEINSATAGFVATLMEWVPDGADRDKALERIREARMWANSAIALEGEIGWPFYSEEVKIR